MVKKIYILLLFFIPAFAGIAQSDRTAAAIEYLKAGQSDKAKQTIDSAVVAPLTKHDPQTWYVRGFVYKEIFNKEHSAGIRSLQTRIEAIASFRQSIRLDSARDFLSDNRKNIAYIAATLNNDAVLSLDTVNYPYAILCFSMFRENMLFLNEGGVAMKKEIEFKLALASVYELLYKSDKKARAGLADTLAQLYLSVIAADSANASANYNLGTLYYNQGVDIIKEMDYDADLVAVDKIQERSIVLFKKALPYMLRSYALDPKRKDVLGGLSGIYFSLNDAEKKKEFDQKLSELGKENK